VTALFCDLVGSTQLAEGLDAESLRAVLDRYFEGMRAAIERHGGAVEKFIGDAVVGTFGLPAAHEDDTFRAVKAALEMREVAARLAREIDDPRIRLQTRTAINCGEVFADLAAARHGRIGGDVFNTAARLQAAAEVGDVLVSDAAARMLDGRVELVALGPVELKGKAEAVEVCRVVGLRSALPVHTSPFVGRDRPLAMLRDAFDDAVEAGACVLVTILAAPGVGKSRLVDAFGDSVQDRATVLVGQTPAYGDGVTFAPLVELLGQAAQVPGGDAETIAAALRRRLAAEHDGESVGKRLAHALGVGEASAGDAAWAVRRLLEAMAAVRPLVVVIEDAHWAERPMLDLVDSVVDRLRGPTLVVCLARPELLEQRPTWAAGKPRSITTTLPPLAAEDARGLAAALLGSGAPATVIDRVCETAEGNPLYLEQLAAMLADQGLLADGRWLGSVDTDVDIPASLHALLAARFDVLEPLARLIAERASIEGRRFRTAVVDALTPELGRDEIERAMESLERRGFVEPEDERTGRWRFSHALLREAAYRGLPKEQRAALHEELADWIRSVDADEPDVDESAARHLERAFHLREELLLHDERSADLARRAGELFADAGVRAFAATDLITTRDLLGRAVALMPTTSLRRLELLPGLGVALSESGRPAEADTLLSDGLEQARAAGSAREVRRATVALLANRIYRTPTEDEVEEAILEARAAAAAFEAEGDDAGLAEAAVALEYLEFMLGRVARQFQWTRVGLARGLVAGSMREATQAAADLITSAVNGPLPFDEFGAVATELLAREDPLSRSAGHALLAIDALAAGDGAGFLEAEKVLHDTVDSHGLTWLGATYELHLGQVELSAGHAEAGERRLGDARETLVGLGDIWWLNPLDSNLCRAALMQNRRQEFLRLADAFEAARYVTDRQLLVRRRLVRAHALLLRGSASDAEAAARDALRLAQPTDLTSDQADAWLTLAETLDARSRPDEAAAARAEAVALLRAKRNVAAIARLGG
jgi:class 3 adenylate cyclase/predicted ATPase